MNPLTWNATFRRFKPFIRKQRDIERAGVSFAGELLPKVFLKSVGKQPGDLDYLQRNVFSILFLALYSCIGIPERRLDFYGTINHAIRGIVTATDNILDDELKPQLPLALPAEAPRFTSVMNILLFDRLIAHAKTSANIDPLVNALNDMELERALMASLAPIGALEAEEEAGRKCVPTPEEVLSKVHDQRGGNLLRLAFVIPLIVEDELREKVARGAEGVYLLGMGLQLVDDLVDFGEDLAGGKHNYLHSLLHHTRGHFDADKALEDSGSYGVEALFPEETELVASKAVDEGLKGFGILHDLGFWIDDSSAKALLSRLFDLRGGGALKPPSLR
ncbi:MAG: hypothetical protein C0609_02515 [Deltaproteobacteria bacterium]|nr:MAG: hypothetical protein C0609_02515 [Deltaproteobacteria bacterium]